MANTVQQQPSAHLYIGSLILSFVSFQDPGYYRRVVTFVLSRVLAVWSIKSEKCQKKIAKYRKNNKTTLLFKPWCKRNGSCETEMKSTEHLIKTTLREKRIYYRRQIFTYISDIFILCPKIYKKKMSAGLYSLFQLQLFHVT